MFYTNLTFSLRIQRREFHKFLYTSPEIFPASCKSQALFSMFNLFKSLIAKTLLIPQRLEFKVKISIHNPIRVSLFTTFYNSFISSNDNDLFNI